MFNLIHLATYSPPTRQRRSPPTVPTPASRRDRGLMTSGCFGRSQTLAVVQPWPIVRETRQHRNAGAGISSSIVSNTARRRRAKASANPVVGEAMGVGESTMRALWIIRQRREAAPDDHPIAGVSLPACRDWSSPSRNEAGVSYRAMKPALVNQWPRGCGARQKIACWRQSSARVAQALTQCRERAFRTIGRRV